MKNANRFTGDRCVLERVLKTRRGALERIPTRGEETKLARSAWWDAGAVKADAIRTSFVRIMRQIGHPESTCPKSWRHTFATLLQDANVAADPATGYGAPAYDNIQTRHDGQVHAHTTENAADAGGSGVETVARVIELSVRYEK